MPAKPLTPEQLNDAARLKAAFERAKEADKDLTQEKLAFASGWKTQGTVSQYMLGKIPLNLDALLKFSRALKISPEQISPSLAKKVEHTSLGPLASNVRPGPDVRDLIPLISWVRAGSWDEAVDIFEPGFAEDWLPCPKKNGPRTYALRVVGDSMTSPYGKSYPDGCIIFVDLDKRSPVSGARIIAKLEGTSEVTFKTYVEDAGRRWLKPLNPQHPPILDPFKVLGTVIGKWEDE